ncbi:MAG: methyltransferase domain-containing protein [Nanoarchaeota archaeon]|nr:methyltransferase domain-containing protein [Nanoarchaeota archaeon]
MKTLSRITLDKKLIPVLKEKASGKYAVLDIGAKKSPYKNYFKYKDYSILDINNDHGNVDYVEDLHKTKLKSNKFNYIIMTEVLEHLYNPQKAVNQVHRICKKDGVVIATTRFIYPYHDVPFDYYRFTEYGLRSLFQNFKSVEIITHGNLFMAAWEIITGYKVFRLLKIFNNLISLFDYRNNAKNPLGFIVIARK